VNLKYRVVSIVTFLLLSLSIGTSILNYVKSLDETQKQLKNSSLPLSIDNIYTEIQKNIIEPNLISSMMASNTFLKDWLVHEEQNVEKITRYLSTVKNKYNMFNTFLVSHKSKNYYSSKGVLEKVAKDNPNSKWYFDFKDIQSKHEINLDFNKHMDESMIMFINYKIFDDQFQYLGATGIALKTSYVNEMLSFFRKKYNFNVYFVNKKGAVVLSEIGMNTLKNINDIKELLPLKDDIFDLNSQTIEYKKENNHFLLNTKYIEELDLYLIVEAQIEDFTKEVQKTFYINLFISLLVTFIVILIILYTIKRYNKQLEFLAHHDPLTALPNRRHFNDNVENALSLFKRNKNDKSLLFFDIDDFKKVNDTYGHLIGDKVLVRIAELLKSTIRKSDYISRWGGEEFSILLHDIDIDKSEAFALKLKNSIASDDLLKKYVQSGVTASFGVTGFKDDDTIDSIVSRVDTALYEAKNSGKNQVKIK